MMMCVNDSHNLSDASLVSRRNSTPDVQNNSEQSAETRLSNRIWYPTVLWPILSPRSFAMRSETVIALIRRGCVHTIDAPRPFAHASSKMYCGTCVVFPHPVDPATSTT
jgi:hypothetical protein